MIITVIFIQIFYVIYIIQDGSVLQTVTGLGSVLSTIWIPDMGIAACFGRSKVFNMNKEILKKNKQILNVPLCYFFLSQDVLLICCTSDWISQNHVLASCRMVLRSQNILGLNRAPCLAVFLERLPLLLQEQYSYERVIVGNTLLLVLLASATR